MLTQEQLATFERLKQEIIDFDDLVRGDREYDEEHQWQLMGAEVEELCKEDFGTFNYFKELCDVIVTSVVFNHHSGKMPRSVEGWYARLVQAGMEWMLPLVIESNRSKLIYFKEDIEKYTEVYLKKMCASLEVGGRYSGVTYTIEKIPKDLRGGKFYTNVIIWRDSTGKYLKGPKYKTTKQLLEEKLNG